ncbi:L-rhamnose/proton symporter RhaT [Flavihumibacter petaseus]|uniref:L-rhamnose/proton symporter n=1 Tax=Flavihumibacter petaseus NBRC 106054 TaxID=1220578 RepID=A0A0E9MZV3_9BACT|nr:L-rhamnose/proton symporter RhaT [Flavihumibacter petaseus]GAO43099.1 L-rhamnose/proton symporter [Flavihumibacter petaseus NBRC 106054]
MQAIFGVIYHFIGGFASGSFYIPFRKVRSWSWETYWLTGGLFSWLIMPPLMAWLTIPDFGKIISETSSSTFCWTFIWGMLWGVGGLMYGLGMRYLGMSLGNSVLLGFTSAFGALAPAIYYDFAPVAGKTGFLELLQTGWGRTVLAGVLVCLIGIYYCGKAGFLKEKELPEEKKKESVKEFNLTKGLVVCIVSGILSACFNYGIEAGAPMAQAANAAWKAQHPEATINFLFQNNVIYVVLLWGGLTSNLAWCLFLHFKNKSFRDYTDKKTPLLNNYLFAALAGITWFMQYLFYGMGESKLGNGASSWILHMAFIILVANIWGFVMGEWKGVSNTTRRNILVGVAAIILSVVLVGYGNSLNNN